MEKSNISSHLLFYGLLLQENLIMVLTVGGGEDDADVFGDDDDIYDDGSNHDNETNQFRPYWAPHKS